MNSDLAGGIATGRRRSWAYLVSGLALLMLIALVVSGAVGFNVSWSHWRPTWTRLFVPAPGNFVFAMGFLVASWGAMRLWFGSRMESLHVTVMLAGITVVLGLACYLPQAGTEGGFHLVAALAWVLGLFFGVLPGQPGRVEFPFDTLAFQLAEFSGLATLAVAGVGIVLHLFRGPLNRRKVRNALDIDVVVGVDDRALDLARALITERAGLPPAPTWYELNRHERAVYRKRRKRSAVVVLHNNAKDPQLAEFRVAGCLPYVVSDRDDVAILRRLAVRKDSTIAIRRFFAVTDKPLDNVRLVRQLSAALSDPAATAGPFIPRLVALVDDPREARQFRLDNLDPQQFYVDAISPEELVARDIVARIAADGNRRRVLLLGDSALTVAILDEIVLRRSFFHERAQKQADVGAQVDERYPIHEVYLVDSHAQAQVDEWVQHRPPGAMLPTALNPVPDPTDDWDEACERWLGVDADGSSMQGADAAVVVTGEACASLSAQALRISPHGSGSRTNAHARTSPVPRAVQVLPTALSAHPPGDNW